MDTRRFAICGKTLDASDPHLQAWLALIYGTVERPRCLCVPEGVDMYVAHYEQYQIKRLPDSGHLHHPGCPAYAPEGTLSGLGTLLGDAVLEAVPGQFELRVDFPWARLGGRSISPGAARDDINNVQATPQRMSLLALLHFLFERAGFNRWTPAMSGKRSQRVVQHYLMDAARAIRVKGIALSDRLYVPEQFDPAHKVDIAQRRRQQLALLNPVADVHPLALIVGEFKRCEPNGQGRKLWIKHLPDVPLLITEPTWQRLQRAFAPLFEARDADNSVPVRLILVALVYARREHTYVIDAASLMLATAQWIPLQGIHELPLIQALIDQRRRFIKPLRYDAKAREAAAFPNALLLDVGDTPVPLHVVSPFMTAGERAAKERAVGEGWCWLTECTVPRLPVVGGKRYDEG